MAIDAYVKLGEGTDKDPNGKPVPDIEGDSDDANHYWWCELRNCGFDLETWDQTSDGKDDSKDKDKEPNSGFKPVQLSKRIDWASTQLFIKCCEAAQATTTKSDDDKGKGRIDRVTVEICRPSGGDKIPFVVVRYYGVRVTHFSIEMNGPEPTESITFEFDDLEFEYQQTDPYTGEPKKAGPKTTHRLGNHPPKAPSTPQGGGGPTILSVSASPAAPAAAPAVAAPGGGGSGSGSHPQLATITDVKIRANFPGHLNLNGFGTLPGSG